LTPKAGLRSWDALDPPYGVYCNPDLNILFNSPKLRPPQRQVLQGRIAQAPPLHRDSSQRGLKQLIAKHRETHDEAIAWYRTARKATWNSLEDVRRHFPSADKVGAVLVFNL
jgi:hypothetical protein